MTQEKSLKLLSEIAIKKVKDVAEPIKEGIRNGNIDPAKIGIVLKKFSKLFEEVTEDKEIKDIIFKETEKYKEGNKKTIELMGAKITIGATRTWWEYNECGDPLWNKLDEIEKQIKEMKKEREQFLQTLVPKTNSIFGIPSSTTVVELLPKLDIEDYGEVVTLIPPIKKSTDGLKYSV